ncbi:hypothetical protein Tco_0517904 [Tanacetum coccineum]
MLANCLGRMILHSKYRCKSQDTQIRNTNPSLNSNCNVAAEMSKQVSISFALGREWVERVDAVCVEVVEVMSLVVMGGRAKFHGRYLPFQFAWVEVSVFVLF